MAEVTASNPPSAPMGFVILSHREPRQLLRLVRTLNRLYGDPPIACHHDFRQCALDTAAFPANVQFVQPSIKTGWAKWSLVEAVLAALKLLYGVARPQWFTLLSGADYPAMPADRVLAELTGGAADAYCDGLLLNEEASSRIRGRRNPQLGHFESDEVRAMKWRHYLGRQLWWPILRTEPDVRLGRRTRHFTSRARTPYDAEFGCYYGDQWFTANARAAEVLVHPTRRHRALQRHLHRRSVPDETYYHTVLHNDRSLVVVPDNRRFSEWHGGGAHPQELTAADVPAILASGAFFARKFAADSPALDALDAALFGTSATQTALEAAGQRRDLAQ